MDQIEMLEKQTVDAYQWAHRLLRSIPQAK